VRIQWKTKKKIADPYDHAKYLARSTAKVQSAEVIDYYRKRKTERKWRFVVLCFFCVSLI
jgi:hypothetical protein